MGVVTMKIVLSRKGFDSGTGKTPSPVFPDGQILSLPIPAPRKYPVSSKRFRDVLWDDRSLAPLVECLSEVQGEQWCHLDPDLRAEGLPRQPEWRAAFGQVDGSQTHLANQGVCRDDLFLFFGSFRQVEEDGRGGWCYVRTAPVVDLIFGWLQVGEMLVLDTDADRDHALGRYPWLSDHPHLNGSLRRAGKNNRIYVATPNLSVAGIGVTGVTGGGVFQTKDSRLILTESEEIDRGAACRRSYWNLSQWFWPADGPSRIRRKVKKRRRDERGVYVNAVGPGQEFVVDVDGVPEAITWLHELFESA